MDLYANPVANRLNKALNKVGPHGYIHGWVHVGAGGPESNPERRAPATSASPTQALSHGGGAAYGSDAAAARRMEQVSQRHSTAANRIVMGADPKKMTLDEAKAADGELTRRAAVLGKPGQLSPQHKALRQAILGKDLAHFNADHANQPIWNDAQGLMQRVEQAINTGNVTPALRKEVAVFNAKHSGNPMWNEGQAMLNRIQREL